MSRRSRRRVKARTVEQLQALVDKWTEKTIAAAARLDGYRRQLASARRRTVARVLERERAKLPPTVEEFNATDGANEIRYVCGKCGKALTDLDLPHGPGVCFPAIHPTRPHVEGACKDCDHDLRPNADLDAAFGGDDAR